MNEQRMNGLLTDPLQIFPRGNWHVAVQWKARYIFIYSIFVLFFYLFWTGFDFEDVFCRHSYISFTTSKLYVIASRPRGHVMRLFSPSLLLSASLVAFLNWKKNPDSLFSFSAHHQLSHEPSISITTIQLISEYPFLSLDLFSFLRTDSFSAHL